MVFELGTPGRLGVLSSDALRPIHVSSDLLALGVRRWDRFVKRDGTGLKLISVCLFLFFTWQPLCAHTEPQVRGWLLLRTDCGCRMCAHCSDIPV